MALRHTQSERRLSSKSAVRVALYEELIAEEDDADQEYLETLADLYSGTEDEFDVVYCPPHGWVPVLPARGGDPRDLTFEAVPPFDYAEDFIDWDEYD